MIWSGGVGGDWSHGRGSLSRPLQDGDMSSDASENIALVTQIAFVTRSRGARGRFWQHTPCLCPRSLPRRRPVPTPHPHAPPATIHPRCQLHDLSTSASRIANFSPSWNKVRPDVCVLAKVRSSTNPTEPLIQSQARVPQKGTRFPHTLALTRRHQTPPLPYTRRLRLNQNSDSWT